MKASNKSPEVTQFLNDMTKDLFGRDRSSSIEKDICVTCGQPATEFEDELSKKEFSISGMCQKCQNSIFGKDED